MVSFIHSTQQQNLAALRERFRNLSGERVARVARWLLNNLTDAQLKAVFGGLTNAQLTALKTRLQAKATALTTLQAQAGE